MIAELSNLSTETLEKFHVALNEVTTELKGDMAFSEAVCNDAFFKLTSVEMAVFQALKIKYLAKK